MRAIPEDPDRWHGSFDGRRARALAVRRRRMGRPRGVLAARARAQGRGGPGAISRASSPRAPRCSASPSLTVEEGLAARGRRPLRADGRRRDARDRRSTPSARRSAPGTSSSRARGAASPASRSSCPSSPKLGFDVLYLPPVHPIGRTHRKGRNNSPTARRSDPGSPWAIGGEAGGHTALHPDLGSDGGVREPDRAGGRARHLDRARLRAQVLARPPLAARAPGLVPPPARRHAQVRREPAQALPGHLQRQLRHRGLARALERAARRRPALGRAGREGVPRRQPAHEADRRSGSG